jgi:hypothetical protein
MQEEEEDDENIELEEIQKFELENDMVSANVKEVSLHQYTNNGFFKKPLNNATWDGLLKKNMCRLRKLTVAFIIYGNPKKLERNAEYLSRCLLRIYKGYIRIRWKVGTLQIKYLNQYYEPLTINELDAWVVHWSMKGEYHKKAVLECINTIADFTNGKMDFFYNFCFFTELEIMGCFRGARYIIPDWKRGKWEACSRTVVNTTMTRISLDSPDSSSPDPYMETLSTFSLSSVTKKIKIHHTQTQNLIFNGRRQLPEYFVIENASVSHAAIRNEFQYFELSPIALESAPLLVDMRVPKFKKNLWSLHKHSHQHYLDYDICKKLPLQPLREPCSPELLQPLNEPCSPELLQPLHEPCSLESPQLLRKTRPLESPPSECLLC